MIEVATNKTKKMATDLKNVIFMAALYLKRVLVKSLVLCYNAVM